VSAPINLNRARKAKARAADKAAAAENRVRFGLSKAERTKQRQEAESARRTLDGAKREAD
jgi:hypothetical protein